MRLFQNIFAYPSYLRHLDRLAPTASTFSARMDALLRDGYCGVHLLEPVASRSAQAFLACGTDLQAQRKWAEEHDMPGMSSPEDILLSQIEEHRTEVLYTQNATQYPPAFMKRLPGSVRMKACWHSPPASPGDLRGYDLVMNNFPDSLELYARQGVRTAYFTPSYDPAMAECQAAGGRAIDVAFVGGYSRHHRARAAILEAVAELGGRHRVAFMLDKGRLTRLAESPLGRLLPLAAHRRPPCVRRVSHDPVFGRAMYSVLSNAKIVLNGAVDSAGADRGNMRCFEAMGCGALLLTDEGRYPEGMTAGVTMEVYKGPADLPAKIVELLADEAKRNGVATGGLNLLRGRYGKAAQWQRFQQLVG